MPLNFDSNKERTLGRRRSAEDIEHERKVLEYRQAVSRQQALVDSAREGLRTNHNLGAGTSQIKKLSQAKSKMQRSE